LQHRQAILIIAGIICALTVSFLPVRGRMNQGPINPENQIVINPTRETSARDLEYVPDEIIVKFKEEAAAYLEDQIIKGMRPHEIELGGSLNEIKGKYRTRGIKRVFKDFKEKARRLERPGQKDKAALNQLEQRLRRRRRRAPEAAAVPELGSSKVIWPMVKHIAVP